jgi:uncharacterized lipoprotein YmbA
MTRARAILVAVVLAFVPSACALLEPLPDPSRFYVLASMETADLAPDRPLRGVTLGIGPIKIPDYVQRPEVVRRTSPTEVRPSAIDRWAGSLDSNVMRVLADNLAGSLGTDRVWTYPSYEITQATYMISIDISRFDLDERNSALLVARWEVADGGDKSRAVSRETHAAEAATGADTKDGVEALSRTLAVLSQDVGAAVRELDRNRRSPR